MDTPLQVDQTGILVVDFQGDFTQVHSGALAVEGTDQSYIDKTIHATRAFKKKGFKLFATQDFHPQNHISFYTSHKNKMPFETIDINGCKQMLWPPHCVQGTENATLLADVDLFENIVTKGMDPNYDSYSGFFDDGGADTGLKDILKSCGMNTLVIYGLATDYCVKATAMDAVQCGFCVILMKDLSKGVAKETTARALIEMEKNHVIIKHSQTYI